MRHPIFEQFFNENNDLFKAVYVKDPSTVQEFVSGTWSTRSPIDFKAFYSQICFTQKLLPAETILRK
jgi:hypothetical protein